LAVGGERKKRARSARGRRGPQREGIILKKGRAKSGKGQRKLGQETHRACRRKRGGGRCGKEADQGNEFLSQFLSKEGEKEGKKKLIMRKKGGRKKEKKKSWDRMSC